MMMQQQDPTQSVYAQGERDIGRDRGRDIERVTERDRERKRERQTERCTHRRLQVTHHSSFRSRTERAKNWIDRMDAKNRVDASTYL
jgi:hypothetical protein